jgi:hypothetical protein
LLRPDFALATLDCQDPAVTESPAALLRLMTRRLAEGLQRRRVTVEPPARTALESSPFAVFGEWLEATEEKLPSGMRILLCLDEYERLEASREKGWGAQFLDWVRHAHQHHPKFAVMLTGSRTFEDLGPAWTDRFISALRIALE